MLDMHESDYLKGYAYGTRDLKSYMRYGWARAKGVVKDTIRVERRYRIDLFSFPYPDSDMSPNDFENGVCDAYLDSVN